MSNDNNGNNKTIQENNRSNWTISPTQKPKIQNSSVISWGVGGKNSTENTNVSPEIETLFPDDVMDQVNAGSIANKGISKSNDTVEELEILDEDFLSTPKKETKREDNKKEDTKRPKIIPVKQPEPRPNIAPVRQPEPVNSNMAVYVPPTPESMYPNQNSQYNNYNPNQSYNNQSNPNNQYNNQPMNNQSMNDSNWMNNQPLSSSKLGVTAISSGAQARDVLENGKFFGNNETKKGRQRKQKAPRPPKVKPMKNNMGLEEPLPYVDETQLLKNFIRADFSNINRSIFSFSAFIFKGAYLIHRKMFIEGLLIIALDFYTLLFLPLPGSLILYFALSFLLAFAANPLYMFEAKLKVKAIRMAKKNRKMNQGELNRLCMKAGGDALILALLLEVTFLGGIIYLSMYKFPNSTIHQIYVNVNKYLDEKAKPVYDGVIDRQVYDVEKYLNITIPEGFSKDVGKIYKYHYIPNGKEEVKSCSLTISRIEKFTDPEDYLKQYKKYEKLDNEIDDVTKGDITWYRLDQEKRSFNKHLNATVINKQVILLEYNSGLEIEDVCEDYYNDIFNSISLKKSEK